MLVYRRAFLTYEEQHKVTNQQMLALAKQTDCILYDTDTRGFHFMNGIMDPFLAHAKLSFAANLNTHA